MNNIKRITVVGALGLGLCGLAIAQVHRSGGFRHGAGHRHVDPASMARHLGEAFPRFAPYDTNKDGQFDGTEKQKISEALADGTLELPHRPPDGVAPTTEKLLDHIGEVYSHIVRYDANQDGHLDETEQDSVREAIENGDFAPHMQRSSHR